MPSRRKATEQDRPGQDRAEQPSAPRQVRLPGFLVDEPVGLGDVVKRATSMAGIRPCGACTRRAAALNRMVTFTGRPS